MLDELRAELAQLEASKNLREFAPVGWRENGRIDIRGRRVIDFTNWDIFNLNSLHKLKYAMQSEIEKLGVGTSASRLSSGTRMNHINCERRIAQFLANESALLFSSKNQALISLLTTLLHNDDLILYEESMQSSVLDAVTLAKCTQANFSLRNLNALEDLLLKFKGAKRKLFLVESYSPINARQNDLTALLSLAQKYGAQVAVDESYAIGIIGLRGAGAGEVFGPTKPFLCQYGSLSLSVACFGAFVSGSAVLINYLVNRASIFGNEIPLPASLASAIEIAIDHVELGHQQRERLALLSTKLKGALMQANIIAADLDLSPIVCIPFASNEIAREIQTALFQRGFFCEVVSGLSGERGMIRLVINCAHEERQIEELIGTLVELCAKVKAG